MLRLTRLLSVACTTALVASCAAPLSPAPASPQQIARLLPTDILLLGEQHDAAEHQVLQRDTVAWLAERRQLAALVIEMAEQGGSTAGLPRDATEDQVRRALAWPATTWPWGSYSPMVMAAVRAGVPVLGANLPRAQMRQAMADAALDSRLPPAALKAQVERIREGHCNALPESQMLPMTRIQIGRDLAMADTALQSRKPGQTVLLVAGNGHVHRTLGVPAHLPPGTSAQVVMALAEPPSGTAAQPSAHDEDAAGADLVMKTPPRPPRDYCAQFRQPAPAAPARQG